MENKEQNNLDIKRPTRSTEEERNQASTIEESSVYRGQVTNLDPAVKYQQISVKETRSPGRPALDRTAELGKALSEMQKIAEKTNNYSFVIDLAEDEIDDEKEHFSRFMQRVRSAAKQQGMKVSVTNPHDNKTARIRLVTNESAKKRLIDKETLGVGLNTILYGPPGTGKTYETVRLAVHICDPDYFEKYKGDSSPVEAEKNYERLFDRYNELILEDRIVFTTFHQSFSYEEFIEGIKPIIDQDSKESSVGYVIEDGVFKTICKNADSDNDKNYVVIIDEINRGNVSRIFGELITLVEPNKRINGTEERRVVLPYSKNAFVSDDGSEGLFGVPDNLFIIGTMNTADRSLTQIDTALRRRFEFEEVGPKPYLLNRNVDGIDLAQMLAAINARIAVLYDRDHMIGHANLMGVESLEELRNRFSKKIIPLLQEYFYDDYEKIQQILNDNSNRSGFIVRDEDTKYLANLDSDESSLMVSDPKTWSVKDFKQIYEFSDNEDQDDGSEE